MTKASNDDRLRALDEKLSKMKKAQAPRKSHQEEHYSQANVAWRMVIELVAGLGIGFGIGIGLDAIFNTRPLFLVLFTLLGFVAGVKTMIRTANEVQAERKAAQAAKDKGAQSPEE